MKDLSRLPPGGAPLLVPRRRFVTGLAAGGALLSLGGIPLGQAEQRPRPSPATTLRGTYFNLNIGYQQVNFTGRTRLATTVNGSLPAPTLRWREGDTITLDVHNHLAEASSLHWHGIILPSNMDGVPGLSFAGIAPGASYRYQFQLQQSGTYWYHSHSGFQEQTGLLGAIIVDPLDADPVVYDREHIVLLSDWSDEDPAKLYGRLKKESHYYNFRQRSVADLWRDLQDKGLAATWQDRAMWNRMRMSDTDIADINGYAYTFLMNGITPDPGWRGLFKRGEKVRLRIINGAAMTIFDIRIPGLKMTVVASDGQNIEPVSVDEFRIGVAETYDVIIQPQDDSAYTLFAQSIDRSGYARGTLSPDPSWTAAVPAMDPPPTLGHRDMGMAHDDTGHGTHQSDSGHDEHNPSDNAVAHQHHGASAMQHRTLPTQQPLAKAGYGNQPSNNRIHHADSEFGPGVDMRAASPMNGLNDPGIGLRHHQHRYRRRVLRYADLVNLGATLDPREPSREIEIHLTGNMARYMWSMNGLRYEDAEPLMLRYGERVRFTLINDTMMTHPIHLHGLWSELETGAPGQLPRKHTVLVQPGARISYLVSADALGRWAFHCHLLFHMPGMFREVRVRRSGQGKEHGHHGHA